MAEYFTESQYNILADWSDKKLAMLAGTNDAIDAEIKKRAVEKEETSDKGGITEIPIDEKGGETWWERIKNLLGEKDDDDESVDWGTYENDEKWGDSLYGDTPSGGGGESLVAENQTSNIVLNLAKNYGINKAIQLAASQFNIPYGAAVFILKTPMGQGAVQDFNRMVGDLNPLYKKDAYSPAVTDQGIMATGRQALGQSTEEVKKQIAASQGRGDFLGYTPDPGNVQAATMTQQQMVEEAQQTGGTVNPHEATKAVYEEPAPTQPVSGPHGGGGQAAGQRTSRPSSYAAVRKYGRAGGGLVGIDYLTRRL